MRYPALTPETRALAGEHFRCACSAASLWKRRLEGILPRDLIDDAATDALLFAAAKYRPDRGAKFSTWVYRCVHWQILNVMQARRRRRARLRGRSVFTIDQPDRASGDDLACHRSRRPDALVEDLDTIERVHARLGDRLFLIAWLHHVEGNTFEEIGVLLDVSESQIQRLCEEARDQAAAVLCSDAA